MLSLNWVVTDVPFSKGLKCLIKSVLKCVEWTTISITLAFQKNFCFGIVLGEPVAVSHQKYVLCGHIYISWGSYQEKPRVQCTYYLHGKTRNSGWTIKWSPSFHLGSFGKYGPWFEASWCNKFIFLPFSVCSADLDLLCSGQLTHHFKFNRFIFQHKISTRWFV